MTVAQQTKAIVLALRDWCRANSGSVFVATDLLHLLDQLRSKPGAPRLGILFFEQQPRDPDRSENGRLDNTFKIVISRGRSLKLEPGQSLTEGSAGGKPMFDLVEEAREIILALRLDDRDPETPDTPGSINGEDTIPVYKGASLFEVQGMLLDAMELRVSLAAQGTVQPPSTTYWGAENTPPP